MLDEYVSEAKRVYNLKRDCEHCHSEDAPSQLVRDEYLRGNVCKNCDEALDEMEHGECRERKRAMKTKFAWAVVRTRFHNGGVVSKHHTREQAERAAKRNRTMGCVCGCCGVVVVADLDNRLPGVEPNDTNGYRAYALCK